MFSVRIVTTDHYMSSPIRGLDVQYADQRGSEVKKVPVVRIFGATPAGQKTCMHVHGVFPYLYVPYDGTVPCDRYLRQFASSLDKAINVAQGHGQSTIQHVYKIVLVSGFPMYGYHDKEQQFLKIYLYNPAMVRKAADLLLGGAVLNKAFQPHEAHIPYTLQLFIDYNLYGMNMINVGAVKFRRRDKDDNGNPVIVRDISFLGSQGSDEGIGSDSRTPVSFTGLLNRSGTATPSRRTWDFENIPSELYLDADVERQSTCELEVDVVAADILNRLEVDANVGTNPGLAALWEDERQRRRDRGESIDIAPPSSQERVDIERAESEMELDKRLHEIVLEQLAFIDSQSQSENEESEEPEVPATPASAIEVHLSQLEDESMSSQETVILDEEEEEKPVVNIESIHRIVSSSQSFCDVKAKPDDGELEDKSLVNILASLAKDSDTPPASQVAAASQVTALEEQDSILSQVSQPRDNELDNKEAEEVLEMSQRIWDEDMTLTPPRDKEGPVVPKADDYDMAGLDETWQESQLKEKPGRESDESDSDSDVIPQLDGSVDEKPTEPKKRGPKRLGVTGPVRYLPRNNPPMPQQMYPGYMNSQPYHSMQSSQQYGNNFCGNYGPTQNYRQWSPGIQQNPGIQPSPGMSQGPGIRQSSNIQQVPHMVQNPYIQRSPAGAQSAPRQENPSGHPNPGMLQNPRLMNPGMMQQSPGVLQSPLTQHSPSMPQKYGMQQSPGTQRSPGSLQSQGIQQNLHMQQSPGSQQNIDMIQSPTMQQTPGRQQSSGMLQSPNMQQNLGTQQSPGMLQSPHMQQSPGTQQSPGMLQIHSGSFSPPAASSWDQGPKYNMQNSPPLVSLYGNNQKPKYAAELSNAQKSNQYQHSPANTYGYQPGLNTPSSYPNSVIRNEVSGYSGGVSHGQPQLSPGYLTSVAHSQQSYQPAQISQGYNKQQTQHLDVSKQQPYSAPQDLSMPGSSDTQLTNTGSTRTISQSLGTLNNTPLLNSNSSQITHWQQRASVLASKSQQRFVSPSQAVGSAGYQVSSSASFSPTSSAGSYVGSERGKTTSASKSGDTYFPQSSLPHSVVQSSHGTEETVIDRENHAKMRSFDSNLSRNTTLPHGYTAKANENMKSSISEYDISSQHTSNILGNVAFSRSTISANSETIFQQHRTPDWNTTSSNTVFAEKFDCNLIGNDTQVATLHARKMVQNPNHGDYVRAQNSQMDGQNIVKWKNSSNAQLRYGITGPGSQGHQNSSNVEVQSKAMKAYEPIKTVSKPLVPPAEGPISRYYRLKRSGGTEAVAGVSSGDVSSPEAHKQSSQQNTTLSSPVDTPDKTSSALHKLLLDQQGVNPVVVPEVLNTVETSSAENKCSASDKGNISSLTNLLLEEDSKEAIIWQSDMLEGQTIAQENTASENKQSSKITMGEDLSSSLNDSQEDLFGNASPLLSPSHYPMKDNFALTSESSFNNENIDGDSSVSVFSDSLDSKDCNEVRIGEHLLNNETVNKADKRNNHSHSLDSLKHSDLSSLSDLKTFVGSVQKESKYGASFQNSNVHFANKTNMTSASVKVGEILAADSLKNDSIAKPPRTDLNSLSQSHFQSNLMQSPNVMLPKPKRKYTRKNPNLPPLKRSVSVPAVPGLKRKRGRPRKDSFNVQLPPPQMQERMKNSFNENFSHQHQQYSLNYQNQQFQQPNYNQQNYSDSAFYSQSNYQTQVPYEEPQFFPQQEMQNQPSFLKELMAENDNFDFQQSVSSCSDSFTSENTEKNTFVDQNETIEKFDTSDDSFDYHEMHRKASQEMQEFHKQQEMLSKSVMQSQKIWSSVSQKEKQVNQKASDLCSPNQNEQKVYATLCPSSAYTFQFKVPTPVYKRLKLRFSSGVRENLNQVVKMHPKDARKYSLMKIGSEIIKLHKLSQSEIERIQEDLLSGKEILGLPPALRQVEIASNDSNAVLQNELSQTLLSSLQENNQKNLAQLYQDGNNIHIQRKQRKSSESLFKNRNIANIPHLKKYRAGFPYFGKGNVGKKVPSKQAHPVLSPELEEDNEVVIKDVSLTDASEGTLTPIKSRTPVAGRSPAHSGGHISEPENREYLESKLKEFEGDLGLTSQSNEPQIFDNESDLFDDQKQVDEYEGSTDSDESEVKNSELNNLPEQDCNNKTEILEKAVEKMDTNEGSFELLHVQEQPVFAAVSQNNEVASEDTLESGSKKNILENELCTKDDINDKSSKISFLAREVNSKDKLLDIDKQEVKTEERFDEDVTKSSACSTEKLISTTVFENEQKTRSRSNSLGSFCSSKCSSRRDSLCNSNDLRNKRQSSVESYDGGIFEKSKSKRKRSSSSNNSQIINSRRSSFDDQENKHKKRKTHSKKKKKKHRYHYDSDSDGIPGVDYIVVGRFKGHKEMRVVLHKINIDRYDSLSAEKMILIQSEKEQTIAKRQKLNSVKREEVFPLKSSLTNGPVQSNAFTGFSAEFEKFLARSRDEIISKSKTGKSRNSCTKMSGSDMNVLGNQENKSSSEESSSKGETASSRRSSTTENSDGSANEHGESSSSDMCLSTNHTQSYENLSTFDSTGELKIFLGELSHRNNSRVNEKNVKQPKLHLSLVKKHSSKRKKGNTIHDRMSRAFVGRKRKKHLSRKPTKLMNSLSVLHNATMEKLTEDMQQSPHKDNNCGPIKLTINLKSLRRSPDFDLYCDDVDSDYDTPYCDTMYKLAWYSPPESETGDLSPPQPLSPEQMTNEDMNQFEKNSHKIHYSQLSNSGEKTPVKKEKQVWREERLSYLDVKKTVNSANSPLMGEKQGLKEERLTLADIQKTIRSANSSEMEGEKGLKEERLTLADIQKTIKTNGAISYKIGHENSLQKESPVLITGIQSSKTNANLSEMEGENKLKEQKVTLYDLKKVRNDTNGMSVQDKNVKESSSFYDSDENRYSTEKQSTGPRSISNDLPVFDKKIERASMQISKQSESVDRSNILENIETEQDNQYGLDLCNDKLIETAESDLMKFPGTYENQEENLFKTSFTQGSIQNEDISNSPGTSNFAQLPPLTITDDLIDDSESDYSNRSNEENISPPDLGPPNIPRFSPRQYPIGSCRNDPPLLTSSKDSLHVDIDQEFFHNAAKLNDTSNCMKLNKLDHINIPNNPPNLIPCKSPGSQSYTALSPRQPYVNSAKESEMKYSNKHMKKRPGQSPAACSSSGSINVVHSEEFSDISDDESEKEIISCQKDQLEKNFSMPALSVTRTNIMNYLQNSASSTHWGASEKDSKLKEIAEFEKQIQEKDSFSNARLFEEKHLDRAVMKNDVREFERKHEYEAVDLSKSYKTDINDENFVKNEFKRRHSVPSFNTDYHASFYNDLTSVERNRIFSQGNYPTNMTSNHSVPILESCKFTSKRSVSLNDSTVNPRYMTVESSSQNGFRNQILEKGNFVNLTSACRGPVLYSPTGIQHNFTGSCLSSSSSGWRNNSFNQVLNNRNLFNDSAQILQGGPSISSNNSPSDANRSIYSICRNRRISDSIIRSVTNSSVIAKEQSLNSEQYNDMFTSDSRNSLNIPYTQLGTGGNKNIRHKATEQSGEENQSRSDINNQRNQSGHSSERGGGDTGPNGNRHLTDKHISLQTLPGCQVITPLTVPPTRECVYESANQFGLPSVQSKEAFYGNPKDASERPREGGGQLLKVSSNMVKTLNEFETCAKSKGLVSWRNLFCAKENLFSSQSDDDSLSDKLDKEPALKYALTGDKNIIVTPCALPPSLSKVQEWLKGRRLYKALKKKSVIPTIRTEDTEADDEMGKANKTEEQSSSGEVRLNLFTGKREVIHKASDPKNEDNPPVLVREEIHHHERVPRDEEEFTERNRSYGKELRERDDAEFDTSPPSKQKRLNDSSQLHSTPMARQSSADLFDSACTPIASGEMTPTGEVDDRKEEDQSGFVTPKRIRPPLRRLSTNTESTLRRAIITSQMKQQFCTPALQKEVSQIEGPTPKNSFGFKVTQQNFQDAKALHENQYLTVMSLEVHVETRGDLRPDPEFDKIQGIFYSLFNDVPPERGTRHETGAIIVDAESANQSKVSSSAANEKSADPVPGTSKSPDPVPGTSKSPDPASSSSKTVQLDKQTVLQKSGVADLEVTYVKDEMQLLQTFIEFIKKWDPDILVGYEIQLLSWGFLLQRASTLNTNLAVAISRVPTSKTSSHMSAEKDEYGADHGSEIHIAGRIVLNLWRLLRHEVTLNVYTFENVAFHVLHRRVPLISFRNLTSWYKHRTHLHRWKVVNHYVTRVKGSLDIMEQLDLIGRTSEFARVFGIEFYHVLSRGSQYRVESMMLRVAKPLNYIPVSPNVHQRARMKAPECIPLTLEPESRFYTDPVVVLDFQSLYPSIMIGYNYCFSTCMGRVEWLSKAHEGPIEFGCTSLKMPPSVLKKRQDDLTYSPNGIAFVKQSVKRGVIPIMVEEILNTRLMVKKAMKDYKGDKTLSRMLDARQLGLKLIANVTYGYTGANFSGRMPCIEVGDSIVRKARETLERSIKLVEETPKWGAKVIYGDTDSMFLLLKGKSKDEAFKIGQDIADTVTKMFPKPVKLKFEKVYLPCVLQTKKRYVGFMYETPDQKEPVYDAKGIETVRRDSCQAVSKVLERSIKILFHSRDVSQVKSYVQHQCQKLMEGTVSLQDCIFAKEFRGMSGYKPGACVPALEIAKKLIRQDGRAEPRVGERVPYVIVYGSPGLPLIQLVKQPMELIQDGSLRLNATYYITKQILPPLSRFLSLLGVDVFTWYQEMPHTGARAIAQAALPQDSKKGTISQYFATSNCPICDQQTKQPICHRCMRDPQMVCVTLSDKITRWERLQQHLNKVCSTCMGCNDSAMVKSCVSLDCPILYRQSRAQKDMNRADNIREVLAKVFR